MSESGLAGHTLRGGETGQTWYSRAGNRSGPTVLLLHGLGMQSAIWAPQVEGLAQDYDVVTPDMLGHGKSTLPPADPLLSDYAEQVRSLMDALGIARAHVAGHSMGALISLELALAYPQRVISLAPLTGIYCRGETAQKAVEARATALEGASDLTPPDETLRRWFGNPVPPHLAKAAEVARWMLLNVNPVGYARTYHTFAKSDRRHEGRLHGLVPPALFMTAEFDPNSTPAMSQAMADAAPNGRCKIIPGERHMMTITAPERVTRELRAFFAEVDRRSDTGVRVVANSPRQTTAH